MEYLEFLNIVINEGIEAAKSDYTKETQKNMLEGSIAGLESCRNRTPSGLLELWERAQEDVNNLFYNTDEPDKYWRTNCYKTEIEWVCNVVSAILYSRNEPPILSWLPTSNGMQKANSILTQAV